MRKNGELKVPHFFIFYGKKNLVRMKWYKCADFWIVLGEAVTGIVAFGLLIAGFLFPPQGVIDSSVIQGVGELFGFATIWMLPKAISAGKKIKLERGGNVLTISEDQE